MAARLITRNEIVEIFAPARKVIQGSIDHARANTTLERYARLHPEIGREAGLQRLAGQGRWIMLADGLVATIETVDGFSVQSTEAQHNQGRYLFGCPGGLFTVKREPHDENDPDDGRYVQEALHELLAEAELAPEIDAEAPIVGYLAVTSTSAMLKIRHPTLPEIMKIPVHDLIPAAMPAPSHPERPRTRARSTRTKTSPAQRPAVDGPPAAP
ncbi:MAG TPA: hypothetical protein VGO48_13380 [Conexibacter sp.]|jgi:hypothetical protein|nr:hypothetical protein [Conexibacter sp.]